MKRGPWLQEREDWNFFILCLLGRAVQIVFIYMGMKNPFGIKEFRDVSVEKWRNEEFSGFMRRQAFYQEAGERSVFYMGCRPPENLNRFFFLFHDPSPHIFFRVLIPLSVFF